MKIGIIVSITTLTTMLSSGATAYADSKERGNRDVDCESRSASTASADGVLSTCAAGRHDPRNADTIGVDKEKRLAADRSDSQAIAEELQSKYGQSSWYENASDAELGTATDDAHTLLSRLSALSLEMGEGVIANERSVLDGIRETVASEQSCRADEKCMASRAAKRSEAAFLAAVVFPLCDLDNTVEMARAELGSEQSSKAADQDVLRADVSDIRSAEKRIAALSAEYVKVRHHAFKGWRSECH